MAGAARETRPVRLHRSMQRESINDHNEGFLEGVCHVIDELRGAGYGEAADAMTARLFVKAEVSGG
jgi:hypothetical protein